MIDELIDYSSRHKLTHIPSALSMLTYIDTIFTNELVKPYQDSIVLGKPFGSQAYYLVWKKLGYLDQISHLSMGVKHTEIDFVDYSEETMGNALGVSIGIAIANPHKTVWVNLTDATLQMGSTLEALQYIGHHNISNIKVTVDNNNMQVTGRTKDVLKVTPVMDMCASYGWIVNHVPGHDPHAIDAQWNSLHDQPTLQIYDTIKGYGVNYMVADPVKWHYKTL